MVSALLDTPDWAGGQQAAVSALTVSQAYQNNSNTARNILPAVAGHQYRLLFLMVDCQDATGVDIQIQDTAGNNVLQYFATGKKTLQIPLIGVNIAIGNGIQAKNVSAQNMTLPDTATIVYQYN